MSLQCYCGGTLVEKKLIDVSKDYVKLVGRPRYSKKSRLRKKFEKQWKSSLFKTDNGMRYLASIMILPLMRPPGYICEKCGKNESFYSAIAKNMIKIEPMTGGAKLTYDYDANLDGEIIKEDK